jgi:general secretion pathway protein H
VAAAGSVSLEIEHACAGMVGLVAATLGGALRGQPPPRPDHAPTGTSSGGAGTFLLRHADDNGVAVRPMAGNRSLAAMAVRPDMKERANHDRANGFTLIEMIVVLAILGMMIGLVVTRGPLHSQHLDAEAAARGLAGALRVARGQAIAQHRPVVVTVAANGYRVDGEPSHAVPTDVALSGDATIRYAPDGSSSGGTIAVRGGTGRIGVAVDWLTGRVHLTSDP